MLGPQAGVGAWQSQTSLNTLIPLASLEGSRETESTGWSSLPLAPGPCPGGRCLADAVPGGVSAGAFPEHWSRSPRPQAGACMAAGEIAPSAGKGLELL